MSLSRLWQQQSKREEARKLLAEIHGWFTEGFDTADLKEAKALLAKLPFEKLPVGAASSREINSWNRTERGKSFLGPFREFVSISMDALLASWFGNLIAYARLLPAVSSLTHSLKRGTNLVLESNQAFNRTIYHLHQELEFAVPFEKTFEECRRYVRLYEEMYAKGLPYAIFEVRFTPAGHDRTLIGAGREHRSTWIDLVCNDSAGFEKYYAAAEALIKQNGARPHLGKFCESIDRSDLERLHREHFARFRELVNEHDPEGKFANEFTRRLFGPAV
jgi:hypothetical protein